MASGIQTKKSRVLLEGVGMAVLGVLFALMANQISPNGIKLSRNYFWMPTNSTVAVPTNTAAQTNVPPQNPQEKLAEVLKAKGLHLADSNQVFKLYNDPRYGMGLIVFVDAREDKPYQEGHVPGAHQLDYYHPANYMSNVLAACAIAEQVIVYCNGGDCTDSQFSAMLLAGEDSLFADFVSAGPPVPKEKLFIYAGGMAEWSTNGWPVETGARKSGLLRPPPTNSTAGAK